MDFEHTESVKELENNMSYSYPKTREEYWNIVDAHWENLYNILTSFLPREQLKEADDLRLNKDRRIVKLFNDAWWNAPDNRSIHSIPDWHILCDLCSESCVLADE